MKQKKKIFFEISTQTNFAMTLNKQTEISQALYDYIHFIFSLTPTPKEKFYDLWIDPNSPNIKNNFLILVFNDPKQQLEELNSFLYNDKLELESRGYNKKSWSCFVTYLREYHIIRRTTTEKTNKRIGPNGEQKNLTEALRVEVPSIVSQTEEMVKGPWNVILPLVCYSDTTREYTYSSPLYSLPSHFIGPNLFFESSVDNKIKFKIPFTIQTICSLDKKELCSRTEDAIFYQSTRTCSSCAKVSVHPLPFCSLCKKPRYCNQTCQKKDWKKHECNKSELIWKFRFA
jgi:hypothetical protein